VICRAVNLTGGLVASLKQFVTQHPRLTAWFVLAVGFVVILVVSAWQVGFTVGQWVALIVTTVGLAGLCVWIIGWEDEEIDEEGEPEQKQA
jgi:CHASE2 domain-containing sensor protein